jgi:hypothetical protein
LSYLSTIWKSHKRRPIIKVIRYFHPKETLHLNYPYISRNSSNKAIDTGLSPLLLSEFDLYQLYAESIDVDVFYDIDTKGGQSGAPAYPEDKDKVKLTGVG